MIIFRGLSPEDVTIHQNNKLYKGEYYILSMENLEKTLEKVKPRMEEARPLLEEKPLYKGLQRIEDKPYLGGTGVRYWM